MSYLLDTNVVAELRKGRRVHAAVREWYAALDGGSLYLSVLVVGELRQGVERIRRYDARAAVRLSRWLEQLEARYANRVLPVDTQVADIWGRMNVPDPLPAIDGLLGATALAHDLTLVTRNVSDLERTGARVFNPFEPKSSRSTR